MVCSVFFLSPKQFTFGLHSFQPNNNKIKNNCVVLISIVNHGKFRHPLPKIGVFVTYLYLPNLRYCIQSQELYVTYVRSSADKSASAANICRVSHGKVHHVPFINNIRVIIVIVDLFHLCMFVFQ